MKSNLTWVHSAETKITVHTQFITIHSTVYTLKNIKNGSHGTIHIFKNYFVTVISVFSFSNNKFNPNRPLNSSFWDDQNFSIPTQDEAQEDGHNKISQGNGK